jgi:hypothetical protein
VIKSSPTGNTLVVIVTVPTVAVMVPLPSVTPPLVIVIVPVGPAGTDAVIVTGLPYALGPDVVTLTTGVSFAIVSVSVEIAAL